MTQEFASAKTAASTIHVVCPHCTVTNRLRQDQLGAAPNCGRCKSALFNGHPTEVDQQQFEKHLTRNQIPLLVDFWAPWCGPCRMMAPAYVQAAQLLEPSVRLLKVDTDAVPDLGQRYNIRSIPTLAIFLDGKELARQAGAMSAADIVRWTKERLSQVR